MRNGGDATARALRCWQELDQQLNAGALSVNGTIEAAYPRGLVRRDFSLNPAEAFEGIRLIEPDRHRALVPGPLLVVAFREGGFGGPRIYRPVSDELRFDTGLYS